MLLDNAIHLRQAQAAAGRGFGGKKWFKNLRDDSRRNSLPRIGNDKLDDIPFDQFTTIWTWQRLLLGNVFNLDVQLAPSGIASLALRARLSITCWMRVESASM